MAPKRGGGNPKKVAVWTSRDKECLPSLMGEKELNEMVEADILPDRVTTRWCPADDEPYLMPHTNEVIVFEDYF